MFSDSTRPPILGSEADKQMLSRLERKAANRWPGIAEELLTELERAEICEDDKLPAHFVKMY